MNSKSLVTQNTPFLESHFAKQPRPSKFEIWKLALQTSLPEHKIRSWYANRRRRQKEYEMGKRKQRAPQQAGLPVQTEAYSANILLVKVLLAIVGELFRSSNIQAVPQIIPGYYHPLANSHAAQLANSYAFQQTQQPMINSNNVITIQPSARLIKTFDIDSLLSKK
ncbi:Protein CBG25749 [Caenorhabditis briggsae]|uniref:Homeobox domain-containing protein n=2 Tax=Caenorhabditis briggsae TaxID=6238 RepID=A0AAE9A210_CAEBR|nr:Protein CBG25749 [Caenorhabditis briggsae]ULT85160.1 hypothetical protein L3Y34_013707 [Caenorhabditis briggsae]CAR99450.1 Protein CBG25749 [Caenorhabditis briggsae]